MKIAIIGGGAAGFFSAIAAKKNYPKANVTIFEKRAAHGYFLLELAPFHHVGTGE